MDCVFRSEESFFEEGEIPVLKKNQEEKDFFDTERSLFQSN
jgi:hypothetical protein